MEEPNGSGFCGTEYDYTLLMSAMQVSVSKHLLDPSFTMIWANDFYYRLIRYPREEYGELFCNRPDIYYQYHHYEEELQKIGEAVMSARQEGLPGFSVVTRMPVNGGRHIWVRLNGTFTDEKYGGFPICYTVITDITDLVEIEQEKSVTYNNIPGFVAKYLIRDQFHMKLLDANDRFREFFGSDGEEYDVLLQQNLKENEELFAAHLESVRRGEHIRLTTRFHSRKGKDIWIQIDGDCVDRIDNDPVYLLLYIDVTDMQEMRQKLEEQTAQLRDALAGAQRASEAKRAFLSRMSHEIRTPMNAIIGMTTIAAAHIRDQARVEDCLKKIGFSSKHLLSIINDVLDMSKIEDGKLNVSHEPFYLQQVMESVTSIIFPQADARGIDFHTSLQETTEEELVGDSVRVSQILLNLLSNAVKFTPAGGQIRLGVKQLSCKNNCVRLRFTVSDTGRGMSEAFLARLYEPFEQERFDSGETGGTGLGMPITRNLVELMGGTISVSSCLGRGTVFNVELPFGVADALAQTVKYPVMDSLKVLVTDNDPDDCTYTALLLERFGIMARQVHSGREAVEEIRAAHDAAEDYDVCLIDWQMPGMDGIETTRQIRAAVGPDTLIIIITAYDCSRIETEAREAGANLFLAKPLFASSLYNSLLSAAGAERLGAGTAVRETWNRTLENRLFLLAEDNELNGEIAQELLRMAGAQVHWTKDGNEAFEWFLSPKGRECDAILMDIQMPGMDGYQTARAIRSAPRDNAQRIPIIAMTANAFREDVAAAMEAGMNAHIAKPVDVNQLYRILEQFMETAEEKGPAVCF